MAISAGVSVGNVGVDASFKSHAEQNREQAEQIGWNTQDAAHTSNADAARRHAERAEDRVAGQSLADRPTTLDRLRDGPGTLDRFEQHD